MILFYVASQKLEGSRRTVGFCFKSIAELALQAKEHFGAQQTV